VGLPKPLDVDSRGRGGKSEDVEVTHFCVQSVNGREDEL
jgi:hypothetical protein